MRVRYPMPASQARERRWDLEREMRQVDAVLRVNPTADLDRHREHLQREFDRLFEALETMEANRERPLCSTGKLLIQLTDLACEAIPSVVGEHQLTQPLTLHRQLAGSVQHSINTRRYSIGAHRHDSPTASILHLVETTLIGQQHRSATQTCLESHQGHSLLA